MTTTLACVFPETLPDAAFVSPLVQVFARVVYVQPVENEPLLSPSPLLQELRQSGRLQTLVPAPLGADRDRFLALIADMQRRGPDYTTQLEMLTLASLNHKSDRGESSPQMIASLLARTDIKEDEREKLALWQARLVLKLGEWNDQQQTGIEDDLARITARQRALFQALGDDDDNDLQAAHVLTPPPREEDPLLPQRLKAWSRLCFHADSHLPGLPVTTHASLMDSIHELYEKQTGQEAYPLPSLILPSSSASASSVPEALQQALSALAQPVAPAQWPELKEQWNRGYRAWQQNLAPHLSAETEQPYHLSIIYFPGITAQALLQSSPEQPAPFSAQTPGCCIGLLTAR